jgi:haloacetate dehalogenase
MRGLDEKLGRSDVRGLGHGSSFAREALAEYEGCFAHPFRIHATCADYRASATIDLDHGEPDPERKHSRARLVLRGGTVGAARDVRSGWRERAEQVTGRALACGHFLARKLPDDTVSELLAFLA